jgi:phosphoserine aminotransferase
MPERSDIVYFGAGPATLPTTVLESSAEVLLNYEKTGSGLVEHSHRSVHALKALADTKARLTQFLDIPDNYGILFLQSGGSGQFASHLQYGWGLGSAPSTPDRQGHIGRRGPETSRH